MFKITVVIFREFLEITLLIGIIAAVTAHIKNSKKYIIAGVLAGSSLASLMAFFATAISNSFNGLGDEIVDASIILITSALISWTVVWMQGYNKKLKKQLDDVSQKINQGIKSKLVISTLVTFTILREGIEILLFLYSLSSATSASVNEYIWGLAIGAGAGIITGFVLYKGIISYGGKYIFKISTILLILIAAGLAAQAAGILTSVGIIEILSDQAWDTSWLIDDASILGKLLSITVGYDAKPNVMQIVFYLSTISITMLMVGIRKKYLGKKSYV